LVKRGALDERFDPYYHKQEFKDIRALFHAKGFKFIGKLIKSWNRGDGPRDGFYTDDIENGVPFLRINNLKENSIDLTDVKLITRQVHEKTLRRSKVTAGDLVFAISGTKDNLGTVSIIPEHIKEANLNSALITLQLDWHQMTKEFFCLLFSLNFVRNQIDFIGKGAAQNNLNNKEISQIQVPVADLKTQKEIVHKFNQAYELKRQKEAEAKALLESMDRYLLEKLGIELPTANEPKKVFYTRFKEVQGKRFDPKPYLPKNQELYNSLSLSKYDKVFLKDLVTQSVAGDWGIETFENGYEERLVIRATEFDNIYNLNLENHRVKYRFLNSVKLAKMDLAEGDLLIEKSGGSENQPVGRIAIITNDLAEKYNLAYSNFIHKIRVNEKVNPLYLFFFLKTVHNNKITDLMQSQTNGIRNLIMSEYFKIPVSLPSKEVQNEIAECIADLSQRAKTLEAEAKEAIETAKAEVERMILGES